MIGLRINLSDKIFLTENKLLVIADKYLHINMKLLKENPIDKLFHIANSKEDVMKLILKK